MLGRIGPAAVETTGTIPKSPSAPAKQNALRRSCRIGSVRGSRALVENRRGDIFEITGGSMLPGLGRMEAIKRQDGDWVVVTVRGIIDPQGRPSFRPSACNEREREFITGKGSPSRSSATQKK